MVCQRICFSGQHALSQELQGILHQTMLQTPICHTTKRNAEMGCDKRRISHTKLQIARTQRSCDFDELCLMC